MGESRRDLSNYRLQQAQQCLKSAKLLLDCEDYKGAANRAYYAIYHAVRSVIALDGIEFVKHSGNMSYFRKEYIKTGIFDVRLSDILSSAFNIRNSSDYNDFYFVSKEETKQQILNAEWTLDVISKYLSER